MNNRKNVLGRGLASILRNSETDITSKKENKNSVVGNISSIKISEITTNPFQPRTVFDEESLYQLSSSIQELGIIQPITIRKLGYNKYQLISGERRLRASKLAGKEKIPAFIRIANDQEMLEMALIENIQRSNLNPIDIALSYKRLIDECNLTQKECSKRIGKKRSTIANYLGLLKLPEVIQLALKKKKVSMGIAKTLINVKNTEKQLNIFYDAIEHGFSVREVEQIVKEFKTISYKRTSKVKNISNNKIPFAIQQIIHNLSKSLKQNIELRKNKKGDGKVIIPFKSDKELQQIISILNQKT